MGINSPPFYNGLVGIWKFWDRVVLFVFRLVIKINIDLHKKSKLLIDWLIVVYLRLSNISSRIVVLKKDSFIHIILFNSMPSVRLIDWLNVLYLTPLSAILQLYHGDQF